jgi:hypothetical protein
MRERKINSGIGHRRLQSTFARVVAERQGVASRSLLLVLRSGPLAFRARGPRVEDAEAADDRSRASSQRSAYYPVRLAGCLQSEKVFVFVGAPRLVTVFRHSTAVSTPKRLLQRKCSVDDSLNRCVSFLFAVGVTYAQHLGAAYQYAPAPEAEPLILDDCIFDAAMLHDLVTGIKRRCSEGRVPKATQVGDGGVDCQPCRRCGFGGG